MLYVICYIDRASLGNASIFGYKESIHIDTTQYNLIVTVVSQSEACLTEKPSFTLAIVSSSILRR